MVDPAVPAAVAADVTYDAIRRRLRKLADAAEDPATQTPEIAPKESLDDLQVRDHAQNIGLRGTYARWLLVLLFVQLEATNVVFTLYAWLGNDWSVPDGVMLEWLSATVVELIGVVLVVVHHLFPTGSAK